ncbi:hypothetical protein DM02DRAFT_629936 [Periconia macrospinosa]|uniref:DUF7514 domain-containing protein n=1 Tax=Periconia macrospinosa TaxID=97972 RepID=A0A2V1DNX4_9PLEO|nr:hypothetical protein DM02DRAFT_629936 [Periconia macrospinosa]
MAPDVKDQKAQEQANDEAAHREAYEYWGYLIREDKCGTDIFNRLLEGIAEVVSKRFEPAQECPDLTPQRLAAFYRAVGGNYDVLFIETPSSDISFIYRSLGAFHSLQPAPDDDGYSCPTVPALKKKGFVAWQTIQLLLGPEEHVPFLQNAVKQFDITDPHTGNLFPKILPKECLPQEPDDAMEAWYETVAARLKREAEDDAANKEKKSNPRVHVNIDEHAPRTSSDMSDDGAPGQGYAAASYFADPFYRKRNRRPPIARHISKEAREARRYEEEKENRGRLINSVRHMLNPFSSRDRSRDRRKSHPASGRYDPAHDGYSDEDDNDMTPMASQPPHIPRYTHTHGYPVSHKRPHPPRRESSISSTDSASDSDGPSNRRRAPAPGASPGVRRRRSHDDPRDYFSTYYDDRDRRYSHDVSSSSSFGGGLPLGPDAVGSGPNGRKNDPSHPPVYGPTKGPIFATHVAHMQPHVAHHTYYSPSPSLTPERRPSMNPGGAPMRSSYRGSPAANGMRYSAPPPPAPAPPPPPAPVPPPPDIHEPPYLRDRDRERDRARDRDRERDRDRDREYPRERDLSPYSPLSGAGNTRHHRRRSEDLPPRERDRDGGRTARSHERVRDEWDQRVTGSRRGSREPSLSRSRSDGRDRERESGSGSGSGRRHRYMSSASSASGVEGGVGGRWYPVDAPWR